MISMAEQPPIYLDYNATTPIDAAAAAAMTAAIPLFGNPSSSHSPGVAAKAAVDTARRQVSQLIGCEPDELLFTSGGSEANNHAIFGAVHAAAVAAGSGDSPLPHVVTSRIEHPAVAEPLKFLAADGRCTVSYVGVDSDGVLLLEELRAALRPETCLVTIMFANNEVGSVQPLAECAAAAHSVGALFHVDAAQAVGKVRCDVGELGCDLLTVVGHKFYGPKGCGALYMKGGAATAKRVTNLIFGAGHERGLRAGTENVILVSGLGAAAEAASRGLAADAAAMQARRDELHEALVEGLGAEGVLLNGPAERLPNTLSVSLVGVDTNELVRLLSADVCCSTGSACHSGEHTVSATLQAMGVGRERALSTLRLSTGKHTTAAEVARAAERLVAVARELLAGKSAL